MNDYYRNFCGGAIGGTNIGSNSESFDVASNITNLV